MYFPPLVLSLLRLSCDTIPASPTHTQRLRCHPRRSSLTWATVLTSTVLPGKTQCRTGKPSRVTASPITTWGASERPFFDRPRLRVVYLHPADNGAGPVASCPLGVNQPVVSSQLRALG